MGHALNMAIQDALIRRKRMQGYAALWVPGTDHAGIATQNVVERQLAAEGLTRHHLGREAFIERVWQWKQRHGGRIAEQMRRLGFSCDWTRERFTMDEGLYRAVRTVFVRLYEEGIIYRGRRVINWCPRCHTALSDIEVEHEELTGELVYIAYPFAEGEGGIEVATTRAETMLGDTAVAVHPDDERYRSLIGRMLRLPLTGREIPIVGDAAVDPEFGTGAVKVTPAHDPTDFEIAQRSRAAGHHRPRRGGRDHRGRRGLRRPGSFRRPHRGQGSPGRGRGAAAGRAPPARGGPLLPLRHGGGALPVGAVVRQGAPPGGSGRRRGPRRRRALRAPPLGEALPAVDGGPARLDHLPPDLVGAPHPGLVLRRLRGGDRGASTTRPLLRAGPPTCARKRTSSTPGSPRRCGPSRRWGGPTTPPTCGPSIPTPCWSPPTTSSTSGWPG